MDGYRTRPTGAVESRWRHLVGMDEGHWGTSAEFLGLRMRHRKPPCITRGATLMLVRLVRVGCRWFIER